MRVRFLRDVPRFRPPGLLNTVVAYKADTEDTVKADWGRILVDNGDAEELDAPVREEPTEEPPKRRSRKVAD